MGKLLLKNSQSVGTKLPKCGETPFLTPLFMGVSAKVIEHITDDAYNRQGDFRDLESVFPAVKTIGKKQSKSLRSGLIG